MTDLLIISLHADPSMPPGIGVYGGGHMYPKELLIGLSNEDYNVSLLTRKSYENLPDVEHINTNCSIYRLDYGTYGIFDKRKLYSLKEKSYELAVKTIAEYNLKFQIIHSIYWNSGQLAIQLGQEYRVPFVHSTISNGKQILLRNAKEIESHRIDVEMAVFQKACHLFCITQSEKQAITKYYQIPGQKISVIGRPVDSAYRFPVHNDLGYTRNITWKDSPYLLPLYQKTNPVSQTVHWWQKQVFSYVGRIDQNKGIDIIISAWYSLYKIYGEACPALWIIGGTPDEIHDFHSTLSIDLQIVEKSGKLIWWGTLDAEGISAVYLRTLAVIMHSKYEPGGRVSLEAMSEGVPVIATKCGFAGDMIIDWENGFLVDYGNIQMLSKRMEHFIWQPYLSCSLGIAAKNCAEKTANNWDFLASHIHVYKKVLYNNFKSSSNDIPESNLNLPDYINTYPYINFPTDEQTVKQYVENYFGIDCYTLNESIVKNHCFCWDILLLHKKYILFQPYSYINKKVFVHDFKDYVEVQSATDRYQRHKYWSSKLPSDTLHCNDQNHLFLCSEGAAVDLENNLPDIIKYIEQNSKMDFINKSTITKNLNTMLEEQLPPKRILESYRSELLCEPWYMEGNSSYCLESQILLQTLYQNKEAEQKIGSVGVAFLKEIAQMFKKTKPLVVSGFVSATCTFYKKSSHLVIHDCEHIHPSWPGEDYAKLFLILMSSDRISGAEFILRKFPEYSRQDIILWSAIILSRHIIFLHNTGANNNDFKKPVIQLELLEKLYHRLRLA